MLQTALAQLTLTQPLDVEGDGPPREFLVCRPGRTSTEHGEYVFDAEAASSVMAAARKYGNDFMVDYGHAAHAPVAADPAEAGKAAGWFRPQVRETAAGPELWAVMVPSKTRPTGWTKRAAALLAEGEYRFTSPVIDVTRDGGRVVRLRSVAITNLPATHEMPPLMASQTPAAPPERPTMKTLLSKLGLSENATEAEALVALEAKLSAPTTQLKQLSQVTGKEGVEMLALVTAWKESAAQVLLLSQELATLKASQAKAELDAVILEGKRAGKVPPAVEPLLRTMPLEQAKAFVAAMPSTLPTAARPGVVEPAPAVDVKALTQEEILIAKQMGNDITKLTESKAKALAAKQ